MSILLPLQEERAAGERCVRAWTQGQDHPRERYEVILLAPGLEPELELAARELVTPQDRWIEHRTTSEYELFNLGAEHARGRYVFPTEAHCIPEPDCLSKMVEHLEGGEKPGARGRSIGFSTSDLGELEHLDYTEAMAPEEQPGYWRKVLIHSLAIRTDLYRELGGFPAQYGDFAVWALAIALTEAGHELDYTPAPAVRHAYTGELGILAAHARDFARGEMEYCATMPEELRARYLDETEEWTDRFGFTRAGALRALRAGVGTRRRSATLARHALTALAGPGAIVALRRAQAEVLRLRVLSRRGTGPRRREVYRAYWAACQRQGRAEWLAQEGGWLQPAPEPARRVDLAGPGERRLVGLYTAEEWEGRRFRWTAPVAGLEVALPDDGPLEGRLEVLPIRPAQPPAAPAVTVDGKRVPCRAENGSIRFPLDGGGVRWIGLAAKPFRPERRSLGLPVAALSFEPR
jgi:hypothetical protein